MASVALVGCSGMLDTDALSQANASRADAGGAAADPTAEVLDGGASGQAPAEDASATHEADAGAGAGSCSEVEATFCEDFERRALREAWSEVAIAPTNAGVDARIEQDVASAGSSTLLVTMPAGLAAVPEARVRKTFAEFDRLSVDLQVELDLKVEQVDVRQQDASAFHLVFTGDGDAYNQYALVLRSGNPGWADLVFLESSAASPSAEPQFGSQLALGSYPLGRWVRLAFQLRLTQPAGAPSGASGEPNQLRVSIDGQDGFPLRPLELPMRGYRPAIDLGIPWLSTELGTGVWRIRYDNVVVRIAPR